MSAKEALINSTVTANCCVMRCSKSSHMSEYAAVSALLFLALYSTQRITQKLPNLNIARALALAMLLASPIAQLSADPAAVYKQRSDAVVLIIARNENSNTQSKGTGSIVADGRVLTNAHVVSDQQGRGYERIVIFLRGQNINDGSRQKLSDGKFAQVLALDAELDLALLAVEQLPATEPIAFSSSANVDIGEQVLAIGHPENGGLWSLTTGRIGARIKNHDNVAGKHVLQTETPLNRGNSGGPLLNWDGELVGVNSSIARSGAGGLAITGVNFAIEADVARAWLQRQSLAVNVLGTTAAMANADQQQSAPKPTTPDLAQQPSAAAALPAAPAPKPAITAEAEPDPVLMNSPRADGLLSRPRPYRDRDLFSAFAQQQRRDFQNFSNSQNAAFEQFRQGK